MASALWAIGATDTPTWGTALSGLASGASSLSSAIDNSTGLYTDAAFNFVSTTASAGTVVVGGYLGITLLYSLDGTTYPTPGSGGSSTGIQQAASIPGLSGASFTSGHTQRFDLMPFAFKILLYNGLGITGPAGTITATLKRLYQTVT